MIDATLLNLCLWPNFSISIKVWIRFILIITCSLSMLLNVSLSMLCRLHGACLWHDKTRQFEVNLFLIRNDRIFYYKQFERNLKQGLGLYKRKASSDIPFSWSMLYTLITYFSVPAASSLMFACSSFQFYQ